MFKLEQTEINFGEIDRNISYPIKVKYYGDTIEVAELSSSCGCTTPKFTNDGHIEVIYKSKDKPTEVLQKVWIWLNDGEPSTVPNKIGQQTRNWQKKHIELTIKGKVK